MDDINKDDKSIVCYKKEGKLVKNWCSLQLKNHTTSPLRMTVSYTIYSKEENPLPTKNHP